MLRLQRKPSWVEGRKVRLRLHLRAATSRAATSKWSRSGEPARGRVTYIIDATPSCQVGLGDGVLAMRIVLGVISPSIDCGNVGTPGSNPPGPGHRFYWTEDLRLEEYVDGQTHLVATENQKYAGTHSGFTTLLREAGPGDRFYEAGSFLFHVESLYWFQPAPGTPLHAGQITVEGLSHDRYDQSLAEMIPIAPHALAITGGTGPYATARGQVTEGSIPPLSVGDEPIRTKILDVRL